MFLEHSRDKTELYESFWENNFDRYFLFQALIVAAPFKLDGGTVSYFKVQKAAGELSTKYPLDSKVRRKFYLNLSY